MKTALVNLMHELKWERDKGAAVLMLLGLSTPLYNIDDSI